MFPLAPISVLVPPTPVAQGEDAGKLTDFPYWVSAWSPLSPEANCTVTPVLAASLRNSSKKLIWLVETRSSGPKSHESVSTLARCWSMTDAQALLSPPAQFLAPTKRTLAPGAMACTD